MNSSDNKFGRSGMVMVHDELVSEYGSIEELDRAIQENLKTKAELLNKFSVEAEFPDSWDSDEVP